MQILGEILKNMIAEIKNGFDELTNRLDVTEEEIS